MLKAFTPVAVLIFSFFAGLEKPSYHEFYIVLVISVGVAMTSIGELDFSLIGFVYQFTALIAEASRLVLTNILLKTLKLDPLSSLYYIAPMCSIFISLAFFVFEYDFLPWDMILTTNFAIMMLINGLIAFTLNLAVVMLISNTSALVLTLAGIIKDILLVTLSIVVFMSPITSLQIIGYSVALIGMNLHKEYKKSPERVVEIMKSFLFCGRSSS
jgi:drug/metabolite transporter (DMT)-like permease